MSEERFYDELLRKQNKLEDKQERIFKEISEVKENQAKLSTYQQEANGALKNHRNKFTSLNNRVREIEDAKLAKSKSCKEYHAKMDSINAYLLDKKAVNRFVNGIILKVSALVGILTGFIYIIFYLVQL